MKITFDDTKKDYFSFFNMISVYKTYAEISESISKEVQPPFSAIDLIINKLALIIVENKFYTATFQSKKIVGIIQFLLGLGEWESINYLSLFGEDLVGENLTIDKISLWKYIVENGIQI